MNDIHTFQNAVPSLDVDGLGPEPSCASDVVGVFRGVILTLVGVGHGDVCATRFSVNTGARAIVDFSCIGVIPVRRIDGETR